MTRDQWWSVVGKAAHLYLIAGTGVIGIMAGATNRPVLALCCIGSLYTLRH